MPMFRGSHWPHIFAAPRLGSFRFGSKAQLRGIVMPTRIRSLPGIAVVVLLATMAAGCASTSSSSGSTGENDPYESFNRKMFALNEALDKNVALPLAKGYRDVVPEPARRGVHNILDNLNAPVTFANDVLQGKAKSAAQTLGRLVVNSTIGIAGFVDVATPMGIPQHHADFGETLADYGAGPGPFLMLPLLGPSDPRDASGNVVDIFFDPTTYMGIPNKGTWMTARRVVSLVDERADNIEAMNEIERSSVDLYAAIRSLYWQHREAEIHGGQPNLQDLPNI